MNSHKNARTTFEGRKLLIERMAVMGLMPAAEAAGISARTAGKWRKRFEEYGLQGLLDLSYQPTRTRSTLDKGMNERIEGLRRRRMSMRCIAAVVGLSLATVCRFLARPGLSSLKALDPVEPVVRYEREAPGELLQMDTKKLDASCDPVIALPQTGTILSKGPAGNSPTWPSTITHEPATCRCTLTSARKPWSSSSRPQWRTIGRWA